MVPDGLATRGAPCALHLPKLVQLSDPAALVRHQCMRNKNEFGWTEEQLKQFGVYRSPEATSALHDALTFANMQLARQGLGGLVAILEGYPEGSAWLVTAPETELNGKARIAKREQGPDTVSAIRRLLVRALADHKYR